MKRNRYLLPLGALLAVLALGAFVWMVRANADDMLHQSARLLANSAGGHAVVDMAVSMPDESASGLVEVWGQRDAGPEGEPAFHLVVLESTKPQAVGMTVVSDGTQVWIWNRDENTVYVGTHEELKAKMAEYHDQYDHSDVDRPEYDESEMPQTPEEAVDKLLEYFNAELDGNAEVYGEFAEVVKLIPIPEQMPEEFRANGGWMNVWLAADDYAPLGFEYTGGAVGSAKVMMRKLQLFTEINADTFPAGTFTFDIPDGAEVVRLAELEPPASLSEEEAAAAVGFDVLTPQTLPGAARLEGISEVRGAVVQRYRLPDGERFTIAQGPASAADAPGDNGQPVTVRGTAGLLFIDDDGQRALLTWSEGENTFWIGGDVTAEQALAIAESLQ